MYLYEMYIKEREGAEIYTTAKGFFTYKVEGDYFQVNDLFILPEYRRNGAGRKFAEKIDEFALANGCHSVLCTTCPAANNWEVSHAYIVAHGYKEINNDDHLIYYKKELKRG